MSRDQHLECGLTKLLALVAEGYEFPDACSKAATYYGVDHDELREAYDNHCLEIERARNPHL